MIITHIEPDVSASWADFCQGPKNSIAIDGYVKGPTLFKEGPFASLDHHSGEGVEVDRFTFPSASAQVYQYREKIRKDFEVGGEFFAHVYLNHGDQDSCLALWQLHHLDFVLRDEERIESLVKLEDLIDRMSGACRLDFKDSLVRQQAWIFQPYTDLRLQGKTYHMQQVGLANLLDKVERRITLYAVGRSEQIDLDDRYEMLRRGTTWGMICEIGPYARCNLLFNGVTTIANTRNLEDGKAIHTILDRSEKGDGMLERMRAKFNEMEGLSAQTKFSWGGGMGMLSSPLIGSSLPWEVVAEEISKYRD